MSQVQLGTLSSSGSAPLVEVNGLRVTFFQGRGFFTRHANVIKAVDDVSFNVNRSEILSLVGESGSGKTTIGRCIAGLVAVNAGSIKFDGKEQVTKLKGSALIDYHKNVQMIFQDPYASLNPRRNVFDTISIPIKRLNGERDQSKIRKQVRDLLIEVGLDAENYLSKLPHQLSGGERQRVNIARCLASNPKLLIADEPTSMLDASQRLNILVLLDQLKLKRDLSVILITHDLASAKKIGGRTAILYRGKIMEIGPTSTILSHPHHPYTELLLASSPRIDLSKDRYNEKAKIVPQIKESEEGGCVFRSRCKYATEICRAREPELLEVERGCRVACHNSLNNPPSAAPSS